MYNILLWKNYTVTKLMKFKSCYYQRIKNYLIMPVWTACRLLCPAP